MIVKKILLPTDFSESTQAVLKYATALARDSGASLLVVHVEEPLAAYGGAGDVFYATVAEGEQRVLQERLEAIVPPDAGVACQHRLVRGDPAREIVRLAEEEAVDLILMGTHGRSGMMRFLMGSVAEAVVRRAGCPVLTIRQPEMALAPS